MLTLLLVLQLQLIVYFSEVMYSTIFIVIILILLVLGLFFIPRFLINRAVKQVVRIFRKHGALDAKHAKTIEELGLVPSRSMFWLRDYKPLAMQLLMSADIVRTTEDNKHYLAEDILATSRFGNHL